MRKFLLSVWSENTWTEIVCCVFPCCGNTEDGYLLPPEILWVDRKLQSVPSSEVSLIGRALLLTTVCPGRHGHLAGRTVSGRSRGTSSSSTAPPRLLQLLQLLLRLHWEDGGDCFSAGGLLITLSVWQWRNFGLQLQTSSFPGTTLSLPLQLMFNNFWAITSGLPRLTTSLVTDTLGGFVISPLSGSGLMGFIAALFVRRQWSFVSRVWCVKDLCLWYDRKRTTDHFNIIRSLQIKSFQYVLHN